MAAFAIALAIFLLWGEGSASIQDHCSDISYWDEMRYETTTKQCCHTKLQQVCTTKSDQVCQDVLELQCEVVAWGECQSTPTSTRSTECGVKYNDFAHQNCEEVTTSVAHTKKVPECKEITKNNCVTDWDVDSNGNKIWAGTETCTPVTWEECQIVEKTVEFPTVKTECDVDSHIKWTEFVDITTNIVGLESKCEVKKAVNCKHVLVNKCAPVVWQECKMEPREECLAVVIHTPTQEKIHQQKCLTGDNSDHLNQIRPQNQIHSVPSDSDSVLRIEAVTKKDIRTIGELKETIETIEDDLEKNTNGLGKRVLFGKSCLAVYTNTQDRVLRVWLKNIGSAEECFKECHIRRTCNFWTWHHHYSGFWALKCVLMSSYGYTNYDNNVISGSRTCNPGGKPWCRGSYYPGGRECCESEDPHGSKCGIGQGDCDSDAGCAGDLVCGRDNCRQYRTDASPRDDCCTTGASVRQ